MLMKSVSEIMKSEMKKKKIQYPPGFATTQQNIKISLRG